MLGSAYIGMGAAESLVSLHNYFLLKNSNNVIADMGYFQFAVPISLLVILPFAYYMSKNYLLKRREAEK